MPRADGTTYVTDRGKRYEAYIASKAWAAKRRQYWKQYGHSCKVRGCDSTAGLEVHHHTYERLGNELLTDLVGVCRLHHEEIHALHDASGRSRSLTLVTERVTGLDLRNATRAKKVRKRRAKKSKEKKVAAPAEPGLKKKTIAQLEHEHRFSPRVDCKCRSCRPPKISVFDTVSQQQRENVGKKKRAKAARAQGVSRKQDERQKAMARRAATVRAHQQAQEVARRIAAGRK